MPYTILVADDEPAIRTMLEMILSSDGHDIVTVPDGRAALEYLKTNTPDAMVLDVKMPEIDGYEVCSRVKRVSRLSGTAVLLLTGFDDEQIRDQARLVGADDIVFKPLSGKSLRSRVAEVIRTKKSASA